MNLKKKKWIITLFILLCVTIVFLHFLLKKDIEYKEIASSETKKIVGSTRENENIQIEYEENIYTFEKECSIKVNISKMDMNKRYNIILKDNNTEKSNETIENKPNIEKEIKLEFQTEGKHQVNIQIIKDNEIIEETEKIVYYVKQYENQFAQELTKKGISTHYSWGNVKFNSMDLIEKMGATYIRDEMMIEAIDKSNGIYNFYNSDRWVNPAKDKKIKILSILDAKYKNGILQNNGKVNNESDLNRYVAYAKEVAKRYPYIKEYEIINEPNAFYTKKEDMYWYSKMIENTTKALKEINSEISVVCGTTMTVDSNVDNRMKSEDFFNAIFENGTYKYTNSYSCHIYDMNRNNNIWFKKMLEKHKEILNQQGGFAKLSISESGCSTYNNSITEEMKADKIIQQYILEDKNDIEIATVYNFRDTGKDLNNREQNFGIISNDYSPKPVYYALKSYYEKTNGAEYIGELTLENGLEAHIYNKDGQPVIITWAIDNQKNVEIEYSNFIAKDIYGNDIENNNNILTITTSPVYLYGLNDIYFYKAISQEIVDKYNKFLEKNNSLLSSNNSLNNIKKDIESLKQYANNINNTSNLAQQTAISKMQEHFDIGTRLINLCSSENINIDYKQLSSILDSLNNIGNSYEDLVTVSTKNNNVDIEYTKQKIEDTKKELQYAKELDAIYPEKIYDFAIDLYNKANYINSLKEENKIKNGLIVSKNEHSIQLLNWAEKFAKLYINKYIEENQISIKYSETEFTNKDVVATVEIPEKAKINNNNGLNQYTFTENGVFTIEYEILGRKLKAELKVNNIDKKEPNITGIVEGKEYENISLVPNVVDDNLLEVILIKDGQTVNNYKIGNKISEYGKYKIIAKDKAKNVSQISFSILNPESPKYTIENTNIISTYIEQLGTDFNKKFNKINEKYDIYRNNKILDKNAFVATGDVVKTISGKEYKIIIKGDINKDGKVNITDIMKLKDMIVKNTPKGEEVKIASDITNDLKINISDVMKLKDKIVNN